MKVYDAASIRNVAVVGHGGCGKTQLVAAMLFAAGAVNRLGKVDDRFTFSVAGEVDANMKSANDEGIIGDGSSGDKIRTVNT